VVLLRWSLPVLPQILAQSVQVADAAKMNASLHFESDFAERVSNSGVELSAGLERQHRELQGVQVPVPHMEKQLGPSAAQQYYQAAIRINLARPRGLLIVRFLDQGLVESTLQTLHKQVQQLAGRRVQAEAGSLTRRHNLISKGSFGFVIVHDSVQQAHCWVDVFADSPLGKSLFDKHQRKTTKKLCSGKRQAINLPLDGETKGTVRIGVGSGFALVHRTTSDPIFAHAPCRQIPPGHYTNGPNGARTVQNRKLKGYPSKKPRT
jgi:hypothetical protein